MNLSNMQTNILQLIANGKISKEIACELHTSVKVVQNEIWRAKANNVCGNRYQLVLKAYQAGIIEME